MRKLSNIQKKVLLSLAIKGPDHIQAIQNKEDLNYASCHRAIKRLEHLELVWISKKDEARGPKAASHYSLTPNGIVESVLHYGADKHLHELLKNWREYTPRYVRYWETFEKKGLLNYVKQKLEGMYPDSASPKYYGDSNNENDRQITFKHHSIVVRRNVLDTMLLEEVFNPYGGHEILNSEKEGRFMEIIAKDSGYIRIWKRWFSVKKFLFKYLERLNKKIIELTEKQ